MKKNIVTISSAAKEKLCEILKKNQTNYIMLSVKSGGCNGFNYDLQPINANPSKHDEVIPLDHTNHLLLCRKSIMYLFGLHIDYTHSILSNEFVFMNPNASNHCGCGKSFC